MSLIKRLLKSILPTQSSPAPISSGEQLARFIFSSNHIRSTAPRVRAGAFLPPPDLKLSVFRKSKMDLSYYASIKSFIESDRKRRIKNTALFSQDCLAALNLTAVPEETQHKWHADIEGWPTGTDKLEHKARLKEVAGALAQQSVLEK